MITCGFVGCVLLLIVTLMLGGNDEGVIDCVLAGDSTWGLDEVADFSLKEKNPQRQSLQQDIMSHHLHSLGSYVHVSHQAF